MLQDSIFSHQYRKHFVVMNRNFVFVKFGAAKLFGLYQVLRFGGILFNAMQISKNEN
jgi:hypothetical protein